MLRWGVALVCAAALQAQSRGVWESRAPFPLALTEVSAAAIGGEVYSVCGIQAGGLRSNRLFVYDTAADRWEQRARLPIDLGADHCNLAAANGKLYFAGGIRVGAGFLTPQTFVYDPATDSWSQKERMAVARGASGVAVLAGKIYVAGGEGAQQLSGTAFEAFDIQTERWEVLPNLPESRTHLTAQAVGGKFYAIGGRTGGIDSVRGDVFEYDPAARSWRRRAPMPTPRAGIASGVIGGRIVVFGGEGPSGRPEGTYAQVEEYDPAANTWRSLAPMPNPRHGFYGATVNSGPDGEAIYLPGGGPGAGLTVSQTHDVFFLRSGAAPGLTPAGIVSAASFEPGLAPGAIASIFAANLSSGEGAATAFPLPTRIAGLEIRIDGEPVPLFFASANQANALIPWDASGTIQVVADNRGLASLPVAIALAAAAPAVFTVEQSGKGQAAALIAGSSRLAGAFPGTDGRPVRRGEVVEIYAAGLGAVDRPPPLGAAAPSAPLARTSLQPAVRIGGVEAEVLFSGLAPGFAGVYQINAAIPPSAPSGGAVELVLEMAGARSQTGVFLGVE